MAICGPKLSLCCSIISIWGIFQLVIMGGLFWANSVALSEDLPEVHANYDGNKTLYHRELYKKIGDAYSLNAEKCWIASGVYILFLLFSVSQLYLHKRNNPN